MESDTNITNLRAIAGTPADGSEIQAWENTLESEGVRISKAQPSGGGTEFTHLGTLSKISRRETAGAADNLSFTVSAKSPDGSGRYWFRVTTSKLPGPQPEASLALTLMLDTGLRQEVIRNIALSRLTPEEAKKLLPVVEAGFGIALCGEKVGLPAARSQESVRKSLRPEEPTSVARQIYAVFAEKCANLQQSLKQFGQLSPTEKAEATDLIRRYEAKFRAHRQLEERLGPLMQVMQQIKLIAEKPEVHHPWPSREFNFNLPPAAAEIPVLPSLSRLAAPEALGGKKGFRPLIRVEKPTARPPLPPPPMPKPFSW